ncbi:restriction endonuclease subunit S [Alkalimonas collagenimarina]|uniref:Restriction endonuclease subunit S n=1 Tax=Alkalimonas collagenimarina TaxID=400390 RepID=A0ABT9H173_9GAMM|nr:restriction endonuclease subunit S [Alkalimonas collagenimarina]MDP4537045.1 restriction endonuclease subunit S [Alkalimonas collagenimarina]
MSWPILKLEDVSHHIRNGASIKQVEGASGLPITRIETIANREVNLDKCGYSDIKPDEYLKYRLKCGDILISHINSEKHLGKCAIFEFERDDIIHGMNLLCFRPNDRVFPKYLFFYLSSELFLSFIPTITKKSVNQASFTVTHFKGLPIPLPPLPIQKQIAAVLEKSDTLRQQCQQIEQELNALAQSVFLEMFGDFRKSDQSDFVKLGECADVCSGVTKGQKLNGKVTSIVPYMRVANVQDGYLDLNEVKEIEAKQSDIEKYVLKPGDILMTEGGDHDKLGRGAVWQGEIDNCIHQNHVFRVRFVNSYLPKFFEYLLQTLYAKQYFLKCAKKTTNLASINITQLKSLPMPNASLQAQQKFVDYIAKLDALKAVAKKTTQYHENTFNSLMQRAFKGELDLTTKA